MTGTENMANNYNYISTKTLFKIIKENSLLLDEKGQLSCDGEIIAKITENEFSILIEFNF